MKKEYYLVLTLVQVMNYGFLTVLKQELMRLGMHIVLAIVTFRNLLSIMILCISWVALAITDKKALWRTDGTADGTYRLTNASGSQCTFNCIDVQSPGIPLGDILIFEGHSIEYGEEFYKYNPATNETSLVVDMEPGSDDSGISTKFIVGTIYFSRNIMILLMN